ncbi:MAG: patatin-like phospholipase family protein [Alphaproteobacteria bacterium]
MLKRLAPLLLISLLAACATPFENPPLNPGEANADRRTIDLSDPDRPVVLVALSGGGARATALGATILRELRSYTYAARGGQRRLVDDVAIVSSVSGGSVTAAYFGVFGPDQLDQLRPDFLDHDNMKALELEAINPANWWRFTFEPYTRIDVLRDMFDQQLFHGRTFATINQPDKPLVILNATDMAAGETFAFTPSRFSDICSDFDRTLLSVGVVSSAAFPIALTPMNFQNHSVERCRDVKMPQWIERSLSSRSEPYLDIEAFKRARYANDLRRGPNAFRDVRYLHFLDGGLADNLGLRSLKAAILSPHFTDCSDQDPKAERWRTGCLLFAINSGKIRKLVVVTVNARSDPPNPLDTDPGRPGELAQISAVTSVPIDSTSANMYAEMQSILDEIKTAAKSAPVDARFGGMKVYSVLVDFDQLRATDPAQRALRDKAKAIPTSWTITAENMEIVDQAGALLLKQHPCFQKLLLDLKAPAPVADANFATSACR